MNDALDIKSLPVADLRTAINDTRALRDACIEGTSTWTVRDAHLTKLCAELQRRWD